ncbi:MAG: ATPase domain-containing protein [Methanocella sp.]
MTLELVKTGISGLDQLLSGGFIKGSTVLVSGNYGAGKTLMALEYAFYQASRGERVLYVSTSEPVFKVRQFASNLNFYDDSLVHTGYRDFAEKGDARRAGSIEFIESSMGIITGLHFTDESSLMEEIRNMVEGKGIQHLIIDPITTITMLYDSETAMRKDILLMGAWLTRLGCTVLLTAEASDSRLLDVEKYLADCVIDLDSHMHEHEREFNIAVQKLRGNRQHMSSQLYTLGRDGLTVVHDLSMRQMSDTSPSTMTGIPDFDRIVRMDYGTSWVLAVDDRADYMPVVESIISNAFNVGDGVVYAPPARQSFQALGGGLRKYGADLDRECAEGNMFLVDHYMRRIPESLRNGVVENYPEVEDIVIFSGRPHTERRWRILSDLNGERCSHDADTLRMRFTAGQSRARERGDLYLSCGNFGELDPGLAGFIRQACDGLIEMYVKGRYQFMRVSKSPDGSVSGEYIMVPSDTKPFLRLVQK